MNLMRCAKAAPSGSFPGYWEVGFDGSLDWFIVADVVMDYITGEPWIVLTAVLDGNSSYPCLCAAGAPPTEIAGFFTQWNQVSLD